MSDRTEPTTLFKKITMAIVPVLALGAFATSAFAEDTVTQGITANGSRTATVADLSLASVDYSHAPQSQSGTMTLTADDSSGSGAGWNVTIETSDFAYSGGPNGRSIAAANFSLVAAGDPVMTAGQPVDVVAGPHAVTQGGTFDSPIKVENAGSAFGAGTYTQALSVELAIPAFSTAGTYTGTLTTTIAAAP